MLFYGSLKTNNCPKETKKNLLSLFWSLSGHWKGTCGRFSDRREEVLKVLKNGQNKKLRKNRSRDINVILASIDGMEGYEFEGFLKSVLKDWDIR